MQERHTAEQAKLARISAFWEKEGGGWSAGGSSASPLPYSPAPAARVYGSTTKWSHADLSDNWTRVEIKMREGGKVLGWLRYVGELQTARSKPGMWLGVELDERVGKHNGTLNGKTYFKCQKMHGMFVRPGNCRKVDNVSGTFESRRHKLRKPRKQRDGGVDRAVKLLQEDEGEKMTISSRRTSLEPEVVASIEDVEGASIDSVVAPVEEKEEEEEVVETEEIEYMEEEVEQATVHILVAGAAYVETEGATSAIAEEVNNIIIIFVVVHDE